MIHSKLTFSFVALVLQRDWKALIKPQNTVAETHLLPFNLREKWPGREQHTAAFNVVVLAQGFQSHCDFLGQGVRTWVLGMSRYSLSWWGCPGTICHGGSVQVQSVVVRMSRHQELKAVGYVISEVRREQCTNSSVQVSLCLHSSGSPA